MFNNEAVIRDPRARLHIHHGPACNYYDAAKRSESEIDKPSIQQHFHNR